MSRSRRAPDGPFELAIDDLASNARGVGHADGKAVFVPDTLPGEQVRYYRTRRRAGHDEGRLDAVLTASPQRVTPGCAHFGVCGGCALQHLDAEGQVAFKQSQLLSALTRIGGVTPERVLAPIIGPQWGYRRRARLGAKHVPKKGGVLVGFRERGSPFVAELAACEVLVPQVGQRLQALQTLIDGLSIRARVPQIEIAGGDRHVALVLRVLDEPSAGDRDNLAAFAAETGLWIYLQPGGLETVTPLLPDTPELTYRLDAFDVELAFEPTDFIQINAEINAAMVAQALALLAPDAGDTVVDLFAGLGNFSLPLARRAGRVVAVEGDAGLSARTRANAQRNAIANIDAHTADLFTPDADAPWWPEQVDLALLDPPRAGAREVLPALAARRPRRIVYCSCHPATLARDAATLVNEHGYQLAAAGVVDMFPHTTHVEAMALLEAM